MNKKTKAYYKIKDRTGNAGVIKYFKKKYGEIIKRLSNKQLIQLNLYNMGLTINALTGERTINTWDKDYIEIPRYNKGEYEGFDLKEVEDDK